MPEKRQVLVVDDDEQLRTTLQEQLTAEGYDVKTASDGEQAINLITGGGFDVAVLDIRMPKVDGFKVLEFTKTSSPRTKVIMLTAYADIRNATKCKELGADDVIEKPYELGDLFDSIHFVTRNL